MPSQKYPASVRQFALNLNFYSPRAYEFVRHTFDYNLPHESTLRKWYAYSNLNVEPGITVASIDFLKAKVAAKRAEKSELVCAVCLDEMAIRQQTIFDQNLGLMIGHVSYGFEKEEERSIAKEAIVFIVSGLNEKFRIPVAYHFINSLIASKKANLLEKVLLQLIEIGVKVVSITFDGHPTNKSMCANLGANLNIYSPSFQPYIVLQEEKIFIFYDVCHTEKLVRAHLDKKGVLIDINDCKVKWCYIENLVKYSKKGFSATHKLNQTHLDWRKRPMNVRMAVETLSKSTADSIDFLRSNGYNEFLGATPTVDFIHVFNDLFDVFNTKFDPNKHQNVFKKALDSENKNDIFKLFDKSIDYIKALKFRCEGGGIQYICKSPAKTGFVGFVINMNSLKMMYMETVEKFKLLKFIPTYYINQDAVEIFFGKIRSLGGFNDNPNVEQFRAAYRKLLANDSIIVSRKGNCESHRTVCNPFTDILFISSRRDMTKGLSENEEEIAMLEEVEKLHEKLADLTAYASSELTDDLPNYTIAHIASIIEEKIKETDNCPDCLKVFDDCEKVADSLICSRSNKTPCMSTCTICKEADRFLKLELLRGDIKFTTIYYSILNNLDVDRMYNEHNFSSHPEHKHYLIRTVAEGYVKIKGVFLAKTANQELHNEKFRYKFRKLIHFYGQ